MASMRWTGVQRVASSNVSTMRKSKYAMDTSSRVGIGNIGMVTANVRLVFVRR